jgi:hypothetical protein
VTLRVIEYSFLGIVGGVEAMKTLEAVAAAKTYLKEVFAEENISDISLEEIEYYGDRWVFTVGFSRPWNTPRTRTQEVLENIGAASPVRRTQKVITMLDDGDASSMKDRLTVNAAQ